MKWDDAKLGDAEWGPEGRSGHNMTQFAVGLGSLLVLAAIIALALLALVKAAGV
jgi:hypothetical protein